MSGKDPTPTPDAAGPEQPGAVADEPAGAAGRPEPAPLFPTGTVPAAPAYRPADAEGGDALGTEEVRTATGAPAHRPLPEGFDPSLSTTAVSQVIATPADLAVPPPAPPQRGGAEGEEPRGGPEPIGGDTDVGADDVGADDEAEPTRVGAPPLVLGADAWQATTHTEPAGAPVPGAERPLSPFDPEPGEPTHAAPVPFPVEETGDPPPPIPDEDLFDEGGGATVADFRLEDLERMRAEQGLPPLDQTGSGVTTPGAATDAPTGSTVRVPLTALDIPTESTPFGGATQPGPFPQAPEPTPTVPASDLRPLEVGTQVTGTYESPDQLPDAFGPAPPPGNVSALGPAFADGDSEIIEASVVTGGWSTVSEVGEPSDTSDQIPAVPAPDSGVSGPVLPPTEQVAAAPDHWGDFDDESGWDSVTGQRRPGGPGQGRKGGRALSAGESGNYTSQRTGVYGRGRAPQAQEGARLVCIRGRDEGTEFPCDKREVTIGRDPRNDVVLQEPSASRMHCTLLYDGSRYTLIDNNSGNGTFVNGQRIDRARVRSGDEIGFGNGVYRFLEIGDVFKSVDAHGVPVLPRGSSTDTLAFLRDRKLLAAGAGIVVLAAVAVVGYLIARTGSAGPNPEVTYRYYMQGIEAFKRRDWAQAETQFSLMLGHAPTHPRGHRYLEAVVQERQAERMLLQAKEARQSGDLVQAFEALQRVTDSVYGPEARDLLKAIHQELDARVARARAALDLGQAEQALQLLRVVEQLRPGRPDVAALTHRALRATGAEAPDAAPASVDTSDRPASAPAASSPPTAAAEPAPRPAARSARPEPPPRAADPDQDEDAGDDGGGEISADEEPAIAKARELFGRGKLRDAMELLDSAKDARAATIVKKKIDRFKKVYAAALADHRAKKTTTAIKQLKQARGYEAKITGGSTPLSAEIQRKIADMYFVDGVSAFTKRDYPRAYKLFRQALTTDEAHEPTLRKMKDMEEVAKKLYEEAYVANSDGDSATARKKWRTVMQIVGSDNEYYRKAKDRLAALK